MNERLISLLLLLLPCDAHLVIRIDFLLTANNTVGNYWVSVHSQYR